MREGEGFIDGDGRPVWLDANALPAEASEVFVFLGCNQRRPRFAIDLCHVPASETNTSLVGATSISVRELAHRAPHDELGVLAYAKGLLHWHAQRAHCGRCGGPTRSAAADTSVDASPVARHCSRASSPQ